MTKCNSPFVFDENQGLTKLEFDTEDQVLFSFSFSVAPFLIEGVLKSKNLPGDPQKSTPFLDVNISAP